jgi:hypothetical protein
VIALLLMIAGGGKLVHFTDYDRRSALHLASEEGHLEGLVRFSRFRAQYTLAVREVVKWLVENGADVNCCDRFGTTPLAGAVGREQNEVEQASWRLALIQSIRLQRTCQALEVISVMQEKI